MKGGFHHPWWVKAQSGSFPASRVTCVSVCGRGFVLRLRRKSQHLPKRGYYGSCWCNHRYIKSTHTSLSHSLTPTPSCCSAYRLENNLPFSYNYPDWTTEAKTQIQGIPAGVCLAYFPQQGLQHGIDKYNTCLLPGLPLTGEHKKRFSEGLLVQLLESLYVWIQSSFSAIWFYAYLYN